MRTIRAHEVDEQASVTLRFSEDRLAQFTCSFGGYHHSTLAIVGEKGRSSLDPAYEYAAGLTIETEIKGKSRRAKFPKRDQVAGELAAFAHYVREDRAPEPSRREGLADRVISDRRPRSPQRHAASSDRATTYTHEHVVGALVGACRLYRRVRSGCCEIRTILATPSTRFTANSRVGS
jgi:predicted dehydrogenase